MRGTMGVYMTQTYRLQSHEKKGVHTLKQMTRAQPQLHLKGVHEGSLCVLCQWHWPQRADRPPKLPKMVFHLWLATPHSVLEHILWQQCEEHE